MKRMNRIAWVSQITAVNVDHDEQGRDGDLAEYVGLRAVHLGAL